MGLDELAGCMEVLKKTLAVASCCTAGKRNAHANGFN